VKVDFWLLENTISRNRDLKFRTLLALQTFRFVLEKEVKFGERTEPSKTASPLVSICTFFKPYVGRDHLKPGENDDVTGVANRRNMATTLALDSETAL
jgi:hypothetical protein